MDLQSNAFMLSVFIFLLFTLLFPYFVFNVSIQRFFVNVCFCRACLHLMLSHFLLISHFLFDCVKILYLNTICFFFLVDIHDLCVCVVKLCDIIGFSYFDWRWSNENVSLQVIVIIDKFNWKSQRVWKENTPYIFPLKMYSTKSKSS